MTMPVKDTVSLDACFSTGAATRHSVGSDELPTALGSNALNVWGLALEMDYKSVYSNSGKAYPRRAPRNRRDFLTHRLPHLHHFKTRGQPYTYFSVKERGLRIRVPNVGDPGFEHAYLSCLAQIENEPAPVYVPPLESVIYFVQPETGGPIKIGFANNVARRLCGLQSANHEKLVLRATVRGTMADERAYHHRFRRHRLHGEWFAPAKVLLKEVKRLARAA